MKKRVNRCVNMHSKSRLAYIFSELSRKMRVKRNAASGRGRVLSGPTCQTPAKFWQGVTDGRQ